MYQITVTRNRPDFRVFIELLYGQEHNVDTDGDSVPLSSRVWTHLYIKDRMSNDPSVVIEAQNNNPLTFEVKSASKKLAELAAIYLFDYCGSTIIYNEEKLSNIAVEALREKYTEELKKAQNSIWHRSTDKNPYPNLG